MKGVHGLTVAGNEGKGTCREMSMVCKELAPGRRRAGETRILEILPLDVAVAGKRDDR